MNTQAQPAHGPGGGGSSRSDALDTTPEQNQPVKPSSKSNPMADTFPSKTYGLIAHLDRADPAVAAFSADGACFEVYDQATFAQKYLPQYFKHSNWGSFVRQLNLYGFTSSRLKDNSDVVVWTHEHFHRDRKDLIKSIKRSKKSKGGSSNINSSSGGNTAHHSGKNPSPVQSDSRVASPSISMGGSSSNHSHSGDNHSDKHMCSADHEWLESEFAHLKQQNNFLEQKLDMLLKLTLRISPASGNIGGGNLEEVDVGAAGEKRRRVTHSGLNSYRSHHATATSAHVAAASTDLAVSPMRPTYYQYGKQSSYEEQKEYVEDDYQHFRDQSRDPPRGETRRASLRSGASSHMSGKSEDGDFKAFIDCMLPDGNDNKESKGVDDCDSMVDPDSVYSGLCRYRVLLLIPGQSKSKVKTKKNRP